jgi:hypothetical protein
MNCDQVFQRLASADRRPLGVQVERHLAACPTCRGLAELFQPAVELLSESVIEQPEAQASPAWQRIWEMAAVADRSAEQLHAASRPRHQTKLSGRALIQAAALVFVGVLLGGVLARGGILGPGNTRLPVSSNESLFPPLPETLGHGRCEHLVTVVREAIESGNCPTCRQPVSKGSIPAALLCMACHRPAPSGPTSFDNPRAPFGTSRLDKVLTLASALRG